MLRETGVAEIFEYSSLRLHIIYLHLFTHIYNYLVKNVGQDYVSSMKILCVASKNSMHKALYIRSIKTGNITVR